MTELSVLSLSVYCSARLPILHPISLLSFGLSMISLYLTMYFKASLLILSIVSAVFLYFHPCSQPFFFSYHTPSFL